MKPILTEINIVPIKPTNGLVGFASLVLDNNMYLGSIGIMSRPEGGYRLTYPTRKIGNSAINIYYPINKSFAAQIEKVVTAEYEKVVNPYVGYRSTDIE